MPAQFDITDDTVENYAWMGRAKAVTKEADVALGVAFDFALAKCFLPGGRDAGYREASVVLHQLIYAARLKAGASGVAVAKGMHFDYFEGVRKLVEQAKQEVFFVDPFLDASFVAKYLPHLTKGAAVRLLVRGERKWLDTLLPAVDAMVKQNGTAIAVREDPNLHDRYLLIDGLACYQSGASFKDGPQNADTTLTAIVDLFATVKDGYNARWNAAKVHR